MFYSTMQAVYNSLIVHVSEVRMIISKETLIYSEKSPTSLVLITLLLAILRCAHVSFTLQ
jgi:hypothetical protein